MAKTKTEDVVKVTAMMPRELWARLRAEAVRRGTTAKELLTTATEQFLKGGQR